MDDFSRRDYTVEDYVVDVAMQDPKISIRTCLMNEWNLTGDLAVDNIQFSTGWYDEEFKGPQVTITEVTDRDSPFELGYGAVRVYGLYQVDIWVPVLRATGKGPGIAKDHKWKIRDEIKSIFKANLTGVGDLKYIVLDGSGRSLDELKRSPPLLRYSLQVSCIYDI